MKLLVDMNRSPNWVAVFNATGFVAEHWARIGRVDASDAEVMTYARAHDYVVGSAIWIFRSARRQRCGSPERGSDPSRQSRSVDPGVIGDAVIDALLATETAEALSIGAPSLEKFSGGTNSSPTVWATFSLPEGARLSSLHQQLMVDMMRKPRDFDAELKALEDKARKLKSRKVQRLGELAISMGRSQRRRTGGSINRAGRNQRCR